MLFLIFINQLIEALNNESFGGAKIGDILIKVLAFADDFALIARTVSEMQKMIRVLQQFSDVMGMKVNLEKSKMMVFKNGGKLSKYEQWWFGKEKIEVVKIYKYLGIWFSSNGKFCNHIQKAVMTSRQTIGRIWNIFINTRMTALNPKIKLFNSIIKSALLYGAEVWGVDRFVEVERVQLWFIKKLFWLKPSTPSFKIYLEFGILPLWIDSIKSFFGYMQRVSCYEDHRFPKICFKNRFGDHHKFSKSFKNVFNMAGIGKV